MKSSYSYLLNVLVLFLVIGCSPAPDGSVKKPMTTEPEPNPNEKKEQQLIIELLAEKTNLINELSDNFLALQKESSVLNAEIISANKETPENLDQHDFLLKSIAGFSEKYKQLQAQNEEYRQRLRDSDLEQFQFTIPDFQQQYAKIVEDYQEQVSNLLNQAQELNQIIEQQQQIITQKEEEIKKLKEQLEDKIAENDSIKNIEPKTDTIVVVTPPPLPPPPPPPPSYTDLEKAYYISGTRKALRKKKIIKCPRLRKAWACKLASTDITGFTPIDIVDTAHLNFPNEYAEFLKLLPTRNSSCYKIGKGYLEILDKECFWEPSEIAVIITK